MKNTKAKQQNNNDLFKNTSNNSKNIMVTKNGIRINLIVEELLKKKRG